MMFQNINQNVVSSISDFKDGPSKNSKELLLDNCSSSNIPICDDSLNSSNSEEINKSTTYPILTDIKNTSNNALIETNNISSESNKMNQADCEYILDVLNKNNLDSVDVNTQDQNKMFEVMNKCMSCVFPVTNEVMEINTQQCMDICLQKVNQKMEQIKPNVDFINKLNIDRVVLDDKIDNTIPKTNELKNSKQNNRNLSVNESMACDNVVSTIAHDFFKCSNHDQDSEVIEFKAMCEKMLKIRGFENNMAYNNSSFTVDDNSSFKIKDKVKPLKFKQLNEDILCCVNDFECVSSTSKSNLAVNLKLLSNNDVLYSNGPSKIINTLDSSDESLPENKNELSNKYHNHRIKTPKITSSPKISKTNSKQLRKMQYQYNNATENILISSSDEETYGVLNDNQLSEKNNYNRKRIINVDLSEKNKRFKTCEPIFSCSSNGLIHEDMLKYINLNKSDC